MQKKLIKTCCALLLIASANTYAEVSSSAECAALRTHVEEEKNQYVLRVNDDIAQTGAFEVVVDLGDLGCLDDIFNLDTSGFYGIWGAVLSGIMAQLTVNFDICGYVNSFTDDIQNRLDSALAGASAQIAYDIGSVGFQRNSPNTDSVFSYNASIGRTSPIYETSASVTVSDLFDEIW